MSHLSDQMRDWAVERTDAVINRFMPDLRWPRHFAGTNPNPMDAASLAFVAAQLHELGVRKIGTRTTAEIVSAAVADMDGKRAEHFYSFFSAESVLAFGKFDENNEIVRGWTEAQRQNAVEAFDTSRLYEPATDTLGHYPNNFWAVLARAESARERLGLLTDRRIFDRALRAVREMLSRNPLGFFDDSRTFAGRFDIYSPDVLLFLEPIWPMLDAAILQRMQLTHVRMFESIALENGASVAWGRSTGALSLNMTMEMGATSLRLGMAANPARTIELIRNAFDQYRGWYADDLISAHRSRMTFAYRGIERLLQMTLDCLAKVVYAARHLEDIPDATASLPSSIVFPPCDEWIPFETNRATGVWMVRHGTWACQLPMVAGAEADYVAWFHQPGLLENPVDCSMICGVPRVMQNNIDYVPAGPPESVEKKPLGLCATFTAMRGFGSSADRVLPAKRRVEYRFDANSLHVTEDLEFEQVPEAISLEIPETDRPLKLAMTCQTPFVQNTLAVSGMPTWRSFWGELRNLHQVRFEPGTRVRFSYVLTPAR
jgi:hypothetical protein